jgi:hypothetical protein
MQQMVAFDVPERLPDVLRWFRDTLEPCTMREYQGSPIMELHMVGPRSKKIRGPDGDVTVHEIVMLGFQTKGAPVPSDWLPEPCFAGVGGHVGGAGAGTGNTLRRQRTPTWPMRSSGSTIRSESSWRI